MCSRDDDPTQVDAPALCADCGHADHSRRTRGECDELVSNGWTWHGCHCAAPER